MWSVTTGMIIQAIAILIAIGIDVFLAVDRVPGNTWSEITGKWGAVTLLVPYTYGVLGGHFFSMWKLGHFIPHPEGVVLLVWSAILVTLLGAGMRSAGHPIPPMLMLFPGIFAGAMLWSVK